MGVFDEFRNIFYFDHDGRLGEFERTVQMDFHDRMVTEDKYSVVFGEEERQITKKKVRYKFEER